MTSKLVIKPLTNNNNDDIYVNNGNIELKVKPKIILEAECTKLEAETERGTKEDHPPRRIKVKRPKMMIKDTGETLEEGIGKKKKRRG